LPITIRMTWKYLMNGVNFFFEIGKYFIFLFLANYLQC
jgi:hypothetical protein